MTLFHTRKGKGRGGRDKTTSQELSRKLRKEKRERKRHLLHVKNLLKVTPFLNTLLLFQNKQINKQTKT